MSAPAWKLNNGQARKFNALLDLFMHEAVVKEAVEIPAEKIKLLILAQRIL